MKQVEVLVNIFTIIDEEIKVLLIKKQSDPYKGYWMIPKTEASNSCCLKESAQYILEKIGLPDTPVYHYNVVSDLQREEGKNYLNISFIGFIDMVRLKISEEESAFEKEWFSIDKLPKMAYNYADIVADNTNFLREKIKKASILNVFFPSDFSLPELQRIYEKLFDIEIDRRNFRKKFLAAGLIEETNHHNEDTKGRPSKLYMFKENYEDVEIL